MSPEDLRSSIPDRARLWIGGHDRSARQFIHSLVANCSRPPTGPVDLAIITAASPDETTYFAEKLISRLVPGHQLWVVLPSPASEFAGHEQKSSEIVPRITSLGLHHVDTCEVDPAWLIARFSLRSESQKSGP